MNQNEIQDALDWALENIKQVSEVDAEESTHIYYGGTLIGGYAGDTRQLFWKVNDESAKILRMMDAVTTENKFCYDCGLRGGCNCG